ncbi:hypothetical protein CR513_03821, partial [Mucuna pruriens]
MNTLASFSNSNLHQWGELSPKLQALPQHIKGSGDVMVFRPASTLRNVIPNKTKHLEVTDLFDIKQSRTETLKQCLAHFSAAMVQGLRASPFSDSLILSRPASMTEIRARVEKHVEVEEGKEDRLQAERAVLAFGKKNTYSF